MGKRLTRIATRTGDNGSTGLGDNTRTSKASLRIQALGDIDELNSSIGLLLCEQLPESARDTLLEIQHQLFNLGGELSIPGVQIVSADSVTYIDEAIDLHNRQLEPLAEFILPGGVRSAAQAHLCRTVARRAERAVVALALAEAVNDFARAYLNRLSDFLFVLARWLNKSAGTSDVLWKSKRLKESLGS